MPSPFDPSGWFAATDPDCTFTEIEQENPSGADTVANISNVTSFASLNEPLGLTGLSLLSGESMFVSFLIEAFEDFKLLYRFDGSGSQLFQSSLNVLTQADTSKIKVTEIGNYRLIQIKYTATTDLENVKGWCFVSNLSGITTSFNSQAAFFGKATDWPANVMPTL